MIVSLVQALSARLFSAKQVPVSALNSQGTGVFTRATVGALLGASILAPLAPAHGAPELRVGVVDMQRALEESDAGKQAQKQYQEEVKRAQSDIDSKKADLEKRQQTFVKQKASLNQKALEEKQEELISLEKELKRSFQDQQESLRRKNQVLVGELIKKLRTVLEDYGKESGYTLILEKGNQSVLFSDNKVEITDQVIQRFNNAR